MKAYAIAGTFADVRQGKQPFAVEVAADSEDAAKEKIISTLGSRHKVKRWQIDIAKIEEISAENITDATVKYAVTGE